MVNTFFSLLNDKLKVENERTSIFSASDLSKKKKKRLEAKREKGKNRFLLFFSFFRLVDVDILFSSNKIRLPIENIEKERKRKREKKKKKKKATRL